MHQKHKKENGKLELLSETSYENIAVGDIPIMLGSQFENGKIFPFMDTLKECPYDRKGHFVVNGTERVIIPQSRMRLNYVVCSKTVKNGNKLTITAEVRSLAEVIHLV